MKTGRSSLWSILGDRLQKANRRPHQSQVIIGAAKIEGAPDLVIEILSPSTAYYDLGRKYKIYEHAGVKEYWLIHPDRKAVEVYINSGDKFRLSQAVEESGILRSELLEGFEAELADIF